MNSFTRLSAALAAGLVPLALLATPAGAIPASDSASAAAVDTIADLVSDYPYAPTWDTADGNDDAVAELWVTAAGAHTITMIEIRHTTSGWYLSTGSGTDAKVGIADAADAGTLLNAADGTVSIAFTDAISLRAYMMAAFDGTPMPRNDGDTYDVTIELDGTTTLTAQFSYPIAVPVVDTTPIDGTLDNTPILMPTAMPGTGSGTSVAWVAAGLVALGATVLGISRRRPLVRAVADRATPRR